MSNFATLTAQLNLNMQNFAANMNKAAILANKFAATMQGKINAGMVEPAKKAKFEFKDVSRIVQGIIISKTFYSGLNAIRRSTDAVWEFSKELEYAQMVYSNLFGSTELANEFINVLKDFAAVTPFTFKQSEQAAKRLLAYGLEYKNIMFVMQGVLAAATVQGNDAIIEPISRAFGQIYTKGRLMNEEMRQLAEAGIPVYEILQEELGLTAKELRNLGRQAVPAKDAINALVVGINKRFGSVLQDASLTTTGIISNIKDNAVMLFAGIFEPLTKGASKTLQKIGRFMYDLRTAFEFKGIGGVFEALIPKDMQEPVKMLISTFRLFFNILKANGTTVVALLKELMLTLLHVFNALAPAILVVVGTFTTLLRAISANETAMKILTVVVVAASAAWALYRLRVLAAAATTALIEAMSVAIVGVGKALKYLGKHPAWLLLTLGLSVFVALAGASDKFRSAINGLYKDMFNFSGINTDKALLPDSKERANDLDKFNEALDGTSSSMDDLANSTGKAAKAAKGLLGFDEVFSLKSPDEGNAVNDWSDFMDGIGSLDFSDIEIPMPDASEIAGGFVENLLEAMGGKEALLSAGIGSILGGAIGMVIGGPTGAKIGAAIGTLAGWFWPQVADKLKLTGVGTVALPIATGIGTAIGYVAGGPLGAVAGAAIGTLVGWLIDSITRGIETGDWSSMAMPIGTGIGAAIGFAVGGPGGAAIGAAIGLAAGAIVDTFWEEITEFLKKPTNKGSIIGGIIGGAIGMWFGPVGFGVGAAIGTAAGGIVTKYWDDIKEALKKPTNTAPLIGMLLGGLIGSIFGPVGIFAGAAIGAAAGGIVGKYWFQIKEALSKPPSIGNIIGMLLGGLIGSIFGPIGTIVGMAIGTAAGGVVNKYWGDIKEKSTTKNVLPFGISAVIGGIIGSVFGPAGTAIGAAIVGAAGSVVSTYWNKIKEFFGELDWSFFSMPSPKITKPTSGKGGNWGVGMVGHATGGVFNREHVARFAEGNKKEAIIPLENNSAMQPFVDAVANGLTAALMPMMSAMSGNNSQLQPVYVGTLIADDRSLKELNRKMQIIQLEDKSRRG